MENVQYEERFFETSDINIAATILAFGIPLVGINRLDPHHCLFEFESTKQIHEIAYNYWARKLTIDPFILLGSLKSIKARLYSER